MPIPVLDLAQMREWEAATWAAGQTEAEVIRRVGLKVAERALALTRPGDAILLLAGKGHNGDDTRAAREHLRDRCADLIDVADPEAVLPELQRRVDTGASFLAPEKPSARPALIIDGLFGIGLNRPLDEGWKKLIAAVNGSKIPVLAVDTPSGLNCETGQPEGAAIEAAVTLTVGAPKTGLLAQTAWPFVGRLEVAADVGLIPCPHRTDWQWTLPGDFAGFPPRRPVAAHKGSFGHLAIVAGSFGFHGASVLAARGAQRARPGLITLFAQENTYYAVAAQLQSVMVGLWKPDVKLFDATKAILIGPGLASPDLPEDMKTLVRRLWRDADVPVVVDASALDWLLPYPLYKGPIRVITPHPGEAARLLGSTAAQVQANRVQAVRDLSQRFGHCWVVLKGHQTLVGRNEGEIFVNPTGNPYLAQGGSGDVLGGYLAGLLAATLPSDLATFVRRSAPAAKAGGEGLHSLQGDAGKAIRYAVWEHGAAADRLQAARPNWVVEDLLNELGNAKT
ncbi:MAG: NAD(P)H-hydrate dehydratase [Verrucomicrobiota bacterium]|jgi:NAD(P)H-hydrate epimerase